MTEYRAGLPERPKRIERLPLNERGYPVPQFVCWLDADGKGVAPETPGSRPDFRMTSELKRRDAVRFKTCWICGGGMGANLAFLIGPMCAVNRTTSEPPSHQDCAEYAAQACPFLVNPDMHRRTNALPEDRQPAPGLALDRNPGVCLIWTTQRFDPFNVPGGGWLIQVGEATQTSWWCEGRSATRAEVVASLDSGMPLLEKSAAEEGEEALGALMLARLAVDRLLPVA